MSSPEVGGESFNHSEEGGGGSKSLEAVQHPRHRSPGKAEPAVCVKGKITGTWSIQTVMMLESSPRRACRMQLASVGLNDPRILSQNSEIKCRYVWTCHVVCSMAAARACPARQARTVSQSRVGALHRLARAGATQQRARPTSPE